MQSANDLSIKAKLTENNCDHGCANTFYTGLAVDIDNDGRKDFLQTNVDNGWNFSQLMSLYNAF